MCRPSRDRSESTPSTRDRVDSGLKDPAPTLPPARLYKTSPLKAIKRMRLPAAGKKIYDLQREKEKCEGKNRTLEKDKRKYNDKITEYKNKLTQADEDIEHNSMRLKEVREELETLTNQAASAVGDLDASPRMRAGTYAVDEDDETQMSNSGYDWLDFDSDDDAEVWEEAQMQDPELFKQNFTSPTIAPATGVTSPQAEEAIPFDELAKVLENGTSVLDPQTWRPIPAQHNAHCWESPVDTDLFHGTSMLFLRDKDKAKNGVFEQQIWEGKNRVYTLQVQGKFKRKPKGPLCFYLSALDDFATLGRISKRLGKMWLSFARNWEKDIDINFHVSPGKPLSLIAPISPKWMGIIETKPGGELPQIGHRLPSYKECIKMTGRDMGHMEDPDLEATYTFEFYTANLDCLYWKFCNIPVLPEISLHNLAPPFAAVPNSSGYVGCLREMGDEDEKFKREGTGGNLCLAQVIHVDR